MRLLLQAVMIIGRQSSTFICKLLLEFPYFAAPENNKTNSDLMLSEHIFKITFSISSDMFCISHVRECTFYYNLAKVYRVVTNSINRQRYYIENFTGKLSLTINTQGGFSVWKKDNIRLGLSLNRKLTLSRHWHLSINILS